MNINPIEIEWSQLTLDEVYVRFEEGVIKICKRYNVDPQMVNLEEYRYILGGL